MATKDQQEKAWDNAKKVRGKDPALYRQDPYGNIIYKPSYGKESPMGWEVDHIKPKSRGGSDSIRNIQALNTKVNKDKGDTLVKRSRHSKTNK
jgi:5-methylcytosine-specific restriction endonuclease McrA